MRVEGCTLDLYCDGQNCDAVERHRIQMRFAGHNRQDCIRQAKKLGWHVGYKWQYCPCCTGRMVFESDLIVQGLTLKELMSLPKGQFGEEEGDADREGD